MFSRDGADVLDIFDLAHVLDHPDSDGILANLRGDVAFHLKAEVFEHQISCHDGKKEPLTEKRQALLPL